MLDFHIAEKRIYPPQKQKEQKEVETKQFQSDDDEDDYDAQIQEGKFERPKKRCFEEYNKFYL